MWNGGYGGGWGWGGWILTAVVAVLFFAVLITAIVAAVRYLSGTHHGAAGAAPGARTAEDMLAERLARGEIDDTEYRQRMTALREHR
ncbi:hypothetical protein MAUB_63570 (plasmid) [Mycolicibacterium aubagnense]|uniref:SHOCT domain-containing protein n=2 Tax=Mycolicibacterium aubagnense TaxID=319707 RepID=A0ABM7IC40_9MYCO|nr:hypothetical protein C1S80_22375 [Mycolicibacterium aubagnense]BBX84253.1 hypothetical protein MAUB_21260 [Mycolicibacterium aubagnense]BBX88156.1 hypothetical protein MAUB_63570 [Mycolicibacterium aubagnense]